MAEEKKIPLSTVRQRLGDEVTAGLALLAIDLLVSAPAKQGTYAQKAGVPWHLVHEGRAYLELAEVDWRELKAAD